MRLVFDTYNSRTTYVELKRARRISRCRTASESFIIKFETKRVFFVATLFQNVFLLKKQQ